jgi:glycosyltransferase involved in cell wall biosynthesis
VRSGTVSTSPDRPHALRSELGFHVRRYGLDGRLTDSGGAAWPGWRACVERWRLALAGCGRVLNMKSVCVVTQSVYETDPRVRRKAEALAAAGYRVDVLSLRGAGAKKSFVLNGVNVDTLGLGKMRGSLARYAFEYAAFFLWVFVRVPLLMRRRRYAAVDVNTLPDFLIFAPIVARWMGTRLILDMHEITPEFYMSKYGMTADSWGVRVLQFLEKASFDFADYVVTINEPIQDLLESRGLARSKSIVVMNAVDESRFSGVDRDAAANPTGETGRFAIIYHGTLTPIYGLDIAVEALAIAAAEIPQAELWILGSGSERDRLAELAQRRGVASRVKLVGHVNPADIPDWLRRSDVGVLPIRRDIFLDFAFPNKLPEFIVSGKPVLVSRLKAIRHYFSEDALAFSTPNDPADLAAQMIGLYRDRERCQQLAARARVEYEPIRWDVMKQRYLDLVNEVAGVSQSVKEPELAQISPVGH